MNVDVNACRRYIQDALAYSGGTHTFEDIKSAIEAGTLQLWPGVSSAVVTEVVDTPQKTILHFFLAGGNLVELEAMLPVIMQWGRENGCTTATLSGRRGWERTFLARKGWTLSRVVLEAPIDGCNEGR